MRPAQRAILNLMAVPADAPDRYATMADLRTALCTAIGVSTEDIDPASGHNLSEAGYRRVRTTWRTDVDRLWGMKLWRQRRPEMMARVEAEVLPKAGRDLVAHALAHGWRVLVMPDEDTAGNAFVTVQLGHPSGDWAFNLTWHSRATGTLRLFSNIRRAPRHYWRDMPSVRHVHEEIAAHPGATL